MPDSKPSRFVLFLCHEKSTASGNVTTVNRIKGFLEKNNYECTVRDPKAVDPEFWLSQSKCFCVIAIHAWHCLIALQSCTLPYILIFGGTDLNYYIEDESRVFEMTPVIEKAVALITFGDSMSAIVKNVWKSLCPGALKQIPQSVDTCPSDFNLQAHLKHRGPHSYENIFLLVAGIRPIKDPLFLVSEFSKWHKTNPDNWLVIIGDKKNEEFYNEVQTCVKEHEGIILLPKLSQEDLLACVESCFALVNSSQGEGMSAAILEAMDLGTPVIARKIPGNQDLIVHKETGFLFETPEEFISLAEELLSNPELRASVVKNAQEMITAKHSYPVEEANYLQLLNAIES